MIVLGIVLLIIGFIAGLSIIWMLGIIAGWCSEQLCSVDVTISEFMVEIPCDMMDSGKSCRTRFGGMFVCTGRLDAKPPGGNRCKSKRTASLATSSSGNSAASSVNRRQARHGLLLVSPIRLVDPWVTAGDGTHRSFPGYFGDSHGSRIRCRCSELSV